MLIRSVVLFAVLVLVSGCASVDMYTFKKDRVDQELRGNQGFMSGQAPDVQGSRQLKRTLFGVDIELKGLSGAEEEETVEEVKSEPREEAPQKPVTDEKVTVISSPDKPGEEEYIK